MQRVLITGGAGFIGSHVADILLASGHDVRILDNLCEQVHPEQRIPGYLNPEAEFIHGDILNPDIVEKAIADVDAVVHLCAAVGVGQSMYEIVGYTRANDVGTAVLLEALTKHPVKRLVVASSMSIYGEGLYIDPDGRPALAVDRSNEQLECGVWDVKDVHDRLLTPIPTPETKPPALSSVYALTKYDQERLCLISGRAYGIETVALRFFNVYGPRQALSNPYTGVLAIFAARLLNDRPPLIFEDGLQLRDFVSVYDIARACKLALERPGLAGEVFNIGSGRSFSVVEVAEKLALVLGKNVKPKISGRYRTGDIRHCFADISKARDLLGYQPQERFETALDELADWLRGQTAVDNADNARAEMLARGLTA